MNTLLIKFSYSSRSYFIVPEVIYVDMLINYFSHSSQSLDFILLPLHDNYSDNQPKILSQ